MYVKWSGIEYVYMLKSLLAGQPQSGHFLMGTIFNVAIR